MAAVYMLFICFSKTYLTLRSFFHKMLYLQNIYTEYYTSGPITMETTPKQRQGGLAKVMPIERAELCLLASLPLQKENFPLAPGSVWWA